MVSVLNRTKELEEVQQRLLELIVEVIPAERAAILLTTDNDPNIFSHHIWNSGEAEISISKTIVNQCLRESVSILCKDVSHDEKLHLVESLTASKTHSVLCTPLLVFEKVIGAIYLDTSNCTAAFDLDHLQLLTGVSGISSRPLENAINIEKLRSENQRLREQLENNHKMIGESAKMKEVLATIATIAPMNSTVLISGDSGTGKELAARAIHQNSGRNKQPFVSINCATLTENLLESELFGHERGAFTGAIAAKKGQFEVADGGTIFLDEIGELPLSLQAKILRVLQEREIMRVGGLKAIKIDVRVIAATNRNLKEEIKNRGFRDDLYYRLNVINLVMPSLRERPEDLPLLARYFINKYNQKCNRNIKGISSEALNCLRSYCWSGNVRELENTIERAVIFSMEDIITLDDLPEAILSYSSTAEGAASGETENGNLTYHEAVSKAKKEIIAQAISKANGSISNAAKELGIHPNNLHRFLKQFNLRGPNS
jgi:transcriptional regulator with GAF, ATPase, and Fis domain